MFTVAFCGYTIHRQTLRQAQMVLAQASRERSGGDIDAWYYADCPVGRGYAKWIKSRA